MHIEHPAHDVSLLHFFPAEITVDIAEKSGLPRMGRVSSVTLRW